LAVELAPVGRAFPDVLSNGLPDELFWIFLPAYPLSCVHPSLLPWGAPSPLHQAVPSVGSHSLLPADFGFVQRPAIRATISVICQMTYEKILRQNPNRPGKRFVFQAPFLTFHNHLFYYHELLDWTSFIAVPV
jgi:hypothetical protein